METILENDFIRIFRAVNVSLSVRTVAPDDIRAHRRDSPSHEVTYPNRLSPVSSRTGGQFLDMPMEFHLDGKRYARYKNDFRNRFCCTTL